MSHKKCGSVAREDWPKMSNLIRSSPFTLPFGTNYSDFKNLVQNKNCVPIIFMDGLYIGFFFNTFYQDKHKLRIFDAGFRDKIE